MVTLEQFIYVVPVLALTASILYYALNLRVANKTQQLQLETRQAQLFMNIYSQLASNEAVDNEYELTHIEMKNREDYLKLLEDRTKYRAFAWFMVYYEGIGVLVRENLVPIELVAQMISGNIIWYWERYGPGFIETRTSMNWPRMMVELEYLYNRVKEYIDEHHPYASDINPDLIGDLNQKL